MTKIYYIAQKYTGREFESLNEAFRIMEFLRNKGLYPFSPIAHAHYYDRFRNTWKVEKDNYVLWDLEICNAMLPNLIMLFSDSCKKDGEWDSKGAKREYDWAIRNDVRIMWINPHTFGMREDQL